MQARANKSKDRQQDSDLDEFEKVDKLVVPLCLIMILTRQYQILEEHKLQGEEDNALEKRVGKKKAVAKKRATRKSGNCCLYQPPI